MTNANWMIEDEHGNASGQGLTREQAMRGAREIADRTGRTWYASSPEEQVPVKPSDRMTYGSYWNLVIGEGRSASQAVAEFDLTTEGGRSSMSEWLSEAESHTLTGRGISLTDEERAVWTRHHDRAVGELFLAAEESEEV